MTSVPSCQNGGKTHLSCFKEPACGPCYSSPRTRVYSPRTAVSKSLNKPLGAVPEGPTTQQVATLHVHAPQLKLQEKSASKEKPDIAKCLQTVQQNGQHRICISTQITVVKISDSNLLASPWAKHCTNCFTYMNAFNSHNNLTRQVPFYPH